jgi:hypothetical protein
MPAAVHLRADYSAPDLHLRAKASQDCNPNRRFLSLAAIAEGRSRQALYDWVQRFNEFGAAGLLDRFGDGAEPRRSESSLPELAGIVEAGPWSVCGTHRQRSTAHGRDAV